MKTIEKFTYVIAFRGEKFVMVRHKDRAWEMPGGRLNPGEDHEQAAVREFFEETGMSLDIIGKIRISKPGGKVFVGLAREPLAGKPIEWNIAEVGEFSELPNDLSFPEVEYCHATETMKSLGARKQCQGYTREGKGRRARRGPC
jgi:8-oxo-dGTP diphosphatase